MHEPAPVALHASYIKSGAKTKQALLESFVAQNAEEDVTCILKKQKSELMEEKQQDFRLTSLPDVTAVVLEPLTRKKLDQKPWLALIGFSGLKKLRLTFIAELHVLLPIQSTLERV